LQGETYQMICLNDTIVIPSTLQQHITQWYHNYLCHLGETRKEKLLDNILHGIISKTQFKLIVKNVRYVKEQKNPQRNMDCSQQKKLRIPLGKMC